MNSLEIVQKLEEVQDSVDRLALVVVAVTLCRSDPKNLGEMLTPLLNEIANNRRFSSNKRVQVHEARNKFKFAPKN